MTIPTTIAASGPYYPNGATTAFPFGFKAASTDDVSVVLVASDGTETVVAPASYTVALAAGDAPGGTVTMAVAPVNDGRELWVFLDPSFLQEIKFEDEGAFNQTILNKVADEAGSRIVWLHDRMSRTIQLPRGEAPVTLPLAASRKGKILGFDAATGAVVPVVGTGAGDASLVAAEDGAGGSLWGSVQGFINKLLSSVGSSIVGFLQGGTGAVLRSAQDKFRDTVCVKDFGATGDGATNDYAAFAAAAATGKAIYVPKGTYRINTPLDLTDIVMFGDGVEFSRIECNSATATDPVLWLGGNSCLRNIEIGWAAARLTGTETAGQRAGIRPYSPTTGLPLQRGAVINNVRVRLCGTGVYDPPGNGPATYFSVTFDGIEIRDFTYRGWDAQSSIRTGNRYDNIYINQAGGPYVASNNVDCGFLLAGEESEVSFGQINVEWLRAGRAVSLTGVRGMAGGAIHIEQFTQRNTYAAAVEFDKTAGYIDALTFYYCPIVTAGWWLMRLKDSTYDGATFNPNSCAFLRIGTLHVKGLNDGSQVVGGTGLTGLTDFAFTDREVGAAGPYALQIDNYVWNTYKTDQAVYQAFPNDPHTLIQSIATASGPPIGKNTAATGYVRRPDGLIEMWGTCSVGANTSVAVNFPTLNGAAFAGFPNACLHVEAHPDDDGTSTYRYSAAAKTTTGFTLRSTASGTITGFWRALGY